MQSGEPILYRKYDLEVISYPTESVWLVWDEICWQLYGRPYCKLIRNTHHSFGVLRRLSNGDKSGYRLEFSLKKKKIVSLDFPSVFFCSFFWTHKNYHLKLALLILLYSSDVWQKKLNRKDGVEFYSCYYFWNPISSLVEILQTLCLIFQFRRRRCHLVQLVQYLSGTARSCRPKTGSSHLETRGGDAYADDELVVIILERWIWQPEVMMLILMMNWSKWFVNQNWTIKFDNRRWWCWFSCESWVAKKIATIKTFLKTNVHPILKILKWYWIGFNYSWAGIGDNFGSRWIPLQVFFPNAKEGDFQFVTMPNLLIRIHPDGQILYILR